MLESTIQSGRSPGVQALDDVLFASNKAGRIPADVTVAKAAHKARVEGMLAEGGSDPTGRMKAVSASSRSRAPPRLEMAYLDTGAR